MSKLLLLALSSLALLSACSDSAQCNSNNDCFAGEVCMEGVCGPQGMNPNNSNSTDNNPTNQSTQNNPNTNGENNPTSSNNVDPNNTNNTIVNPNNSEPDMGGEQDMEPDSSTRLECEVDHLESSCSDDEYEQNNTWIDGVRLHNDPRPGCITTSQFNPLDLTLTATKCTRDQADWYYIDFNPCRETYLRVTWTMTPKAECRADLIALESLSFDCPEEATCTSTDTEHKIVIDVPPTQSPQSLLSYVAVTSLQGVQSEYDLRVVVEQR